LVLIPSFVQVYTLFPLVFIKNGLSQILLAVTAPLSAFFEG